MSTTEETTTPGASGGTLHAVSRRRVLQVGAAGTAAIGFGAATSILKGNLATRGLLSPDGVLEAGGIAFADSVYTEVYPTSPLILSPFIDALVIPPALRPVPKDVYTSGKGEWLRAPGPGDGMQSSLDNQKHQMWVDHPRVVATNGKVVDPLVYKIDVKVAEHGFTSSNVRPIKSDGTTAQAFGPNGQPIAVPAEGVPLPKSTIYGFNGTFPGSRINAEYGQPVVVRFENHLEENPSNLTRQDFGTEDYSFLIHLHNGHTAPESDGNPHYSMTMGPKHHGYVPDAMSTAYKSAGGTCSYVDNLYLNWPAGGDDAEKQSFFWFHDHRMDQTGSNVYKGMVGLFPIYDPKNGLDMGDETKGLRLPGVRHDNGDGSFEVDYDIPLALYDARLDDGTTVHHDIHDTEYAKVPFSIPGNATHPEWWGKTFFKHFPNHGFTGDIFTVNGTAFPVMEVKRRKYRLRFLDASISRIYELKLMTSTQGPKSAVSLGYSGNDLQGQYRIEDGQQCMKFTQIASDGGLIPFPIVRDSFELWPAKRREFVVDFTKYMDGSPTKKGDVIYLTNVMKMPDGRMWSNSSRFSSDPKYKVPMMKIVIGDDAPDNSVDPLVTAKKGPLRPLPAVPAGWQSQIDNRMVFEVQRGSAGGETEWLINGQPFDPSKPVNSLKNPKGWSGPAEQKVDSWNVWEIRNGGGGWVHPFHLHMEEHRTVMRNGKLMMNPDGTQKPDPAHPDDGSREDLAALDPSESVLILRRFRDFVGPYVAHCHNLAHEDHQMMFGWSITPNP
jgi:FtsP/CotA-like multicopper oxidase with cupredoxin domain